MYIENAELYFVYTARNCVKMFYLPYINFLKVNQTYSTDDFYMKECMF